MDKHFYNLASSEKLGWNPSWFGAEGFGDHLIERITAYQANHGLTADGMCGPGTYRRLWTEREATISDYRPVEAFNDSIVYDGNHFRIEWPQVVLWSDQGGLKAPKGTYRSHSGLKPRKPTMFVNHWDVCLSSRSCHKVLAKRGISVHFLIDNDGTIYQTMDMQHVAWHAGGKAWNNASIGVEITNAYYPKYQPWYEKHGHGLRPVTRGFVHGSYLKPHLGFYPVQLDALKALWYAVHLATGIPLKAPLNDNGSECTTVYPEAVRGTFSGYVNHYNLKSTKIDCAGLGINALLQDIR